MDTIEALLRQARECSGLTRAELARRVGTTRAALLEYEKGVRRPRADTFLRLLDEAGAEFTISLATPMRLDTEKHAPPGANLAEATTRLTSDDALNWRGLVSDFVANDFVPAPAHLRSAMLAAPPPLSGSNRWDIFVCALAEHLAFHAEVDLPSWVDHERTVTPYWWPVHGALPSQRAAAMGHSPASFRSRGILVDGRELPIVTR